LRTPLRGRRGWLLLRRYRCGLVVLLALMVVTLCLPCWGCLMGVRLRLMVAG